MNSTHEKVDRLFLVADIGELLTNYLAVRMLLKERGKVFLVFVRFPGIDLRAGMDFNVRLLSKIVDKDDIVELTTGGQYREYLGEARHKMAHLVSVTRAFFLASSELNEKFLVGQFVFSFSSQIYLSLNGEMAVVPEIVLREAQSALVDVAADYDRPDLLVANYLRGNNE